MKALKHVVTSLGMSPIIFTYIADAYPFGYMGFLEIIEVEEDEFIPALPLQVGNEQYWILIDSAELRNYLDTCAKNNLTNEFNNDLRFIDALDFSEINFN